MVAIWRGVSGSGARAMSMDNAGRLIMFVFARRFALAAPVLAGLLLTPAPGPAPVASSSENVRYAAIVVDATSGEVLFARRADSPRYPASITKVMTLYLVFEALRDGRLSLEDRITISPRAASQPPSKLGLAAGQTISVDDAIRALAVRSANDIAVALAEHVGGSEARFTAQMTLRARELGMTESRFVNANGLPDSRQISSARDLAVLSRAVMRDFPQFYHYFGTRQWTYGGRTYNNTNGLLHSGEGYDGIKTGYTNASGYNLAASQVRDGKRLITVVLGGRTSRTRNDHVDELTRTGFEVFRRREAGEPIQIAQTFFESRGYGLPSQPAGPVAYASLNATAATAPEPLPEPEAPRAVLTAAAAPADLTEVLNRTAGQTVESRPQPSGRWQVQVGAFRDQSVAESWLTEVGRRFRAQFREAEGAVQSAAGWYRARYTGLTQEAAEAACLAMTERNVSCLVLRPD